MAEEAYGMARIEKPRERKEGWEKWSPTAKCVLMSGGNTNRAVHEKKTAKLQLLSGPLLSLFVMCQDSGPTEVIESEQGGSVGPRWSGRSWKSNNTVSAGESRRCPE